MTPAEITALAERLKKLAYGLCYMEESIDIDTAATALLQLGEERDREDRLVRAGWTFQISPEQWFRWFDPVSGKTVMYPDRAEAARLAEEAMKNG